MVRTRSGRKTVTLAEDQPHQPHEPEEQAVVQHQAVFEEDQQMPLGELEEEEVMYHSPLEAEGQQPLEVQRDEQMMAQHQPAYVEDEEEEQLPLDYQESLEHHQPVEEQREYVEVSDSDEETFGEGWSESDFDDMHFADLAVLQARLFPEHSNQQFSTASERLARQGRNIQAVEALREQFMPPPTNRSFSTASARVVQWSRDRETAEAAAEAALLQHPVGPHARFIAYGHQTRDVDQLNREPDAGYQYGFGPAAGPSARLVAYGQSSRGSYTLTVAGTPSLQAVAGHQTMFPSGSRLASYEQQLREESSTTAPVRTTESRKRSAVQPRSSCKCRKRTRKEAAQLCQCRQKEELQLLLAAEEDAITEYAEGQKDISTAHEVVAAKERRRSLERELYLDNQAASTKAFVYLQNRDRVTPSLQRDMDRIRENQRRADTAERRQQQSLQLCKAVLEMTIQRAKRTKAARLDATRAVDDHPLTKEQLVITRQCPICYNENPRKRAMMTACGHVLCLNCAERLDPVENSDPVIFICPSCRALTAFQRMFETAVEGDQTDEHTRTRVRTRT